jgi:RNA polymerase sigma-70 factor (ECF subfamily)
MTNAEFPVLRDSKADPSEWWAATVETLLDPVYRFVRSRVPPEAVDDLVQETFVAASRGVPSFDRRCPVWNWLTRIARNKIAEFYRQRHCRHVLHEALCALAPQDGCLLGALRQEVPLPEELCQKEEFRLLARAAIDALGPEQRECLVARYNEGLSLDELGRRFGVSPAAVNARLYRARKELRESLMGLICGEMDDQECES